MSRQSLATAGLFLSLATLTIPAARARTFDFSYTLPGFDAATYVTASGVLTTSDAAASGGYSITGITGSRSFVLDGVGTSQVITGLLSPDVAYGASNEIFPGVAVLNQTNFTYTLAGGFGGDDFAGDVNLSYFDGTASGQPSGFEEPLEGFGPGTLTITPAANGSAVPEPASLAMLGAALLAMVGCQHRAGRPGPGA